jgi:hypothetical protein
VHTSVSLLTEVSLWPLEGGQELAALCLGFNGPSGDCRSTWSHRCDRRGLRLWRLGRSHRGVNESIGLQDRCYRQGSVICVDAPWAFPPITLDQEGDGPRLKRW